VLGARLPCVPTQHPARRAGWRWLGKPGGRGRIGLPQPQQFRPCIRHLKIRVELCFLSRQAGCPGISLPGRPVICRTFAILRGRVRRLRPLGVRHCFPQPGRGCLQGLPPWCRALLAFGPVLVCDEVELGR
jgi:hypothetical protein